MHRSTAHHPRGSNRSELSQVGLSVLLIGVLQIASGIFRLLPAYQSWTEGFPVRPLFTANQTLALGIAFVVTALICFRRDKTHRHHRDH